MKISLLAQALGLDYAGRDFDVASFATLKEATPSQIAFFKDAKLLDDLKNTQAGVVILPKAFLEVLPSTSEALVSDDPYLSMAYASRYFAKKVFDASIAPSIDPTASIERNVVIGSGSVIEANARIMPNVTIGANVTVGQKRRHLSERRRLRRLRYQRRNDSSSRRRDRKRRFRIRAY